jgi:hypothetical protein
VEWLLADDDTWIQVDDAKELDALLVGTLAMTAANRAQIAAARALMQRVKRLIQLRQAERAWPRRARAWRVH